MVERLVILGAGGHAKMVIDVARSQGRYEPVLCLARDVDPAQRVLGVEVAIEDQQRLRELQLAGVAAFPAVGDNKIRRKLLVNLQQLGFHVPTLVAANAWLSPSAQLGAGTVLMPGATVGSDARVGNGVIINTHASIDHDCHLADYCHVGPGTTLAGNVRLGEAAFMGAGSVVIPEQTIGAGAIVGAGGVVVTQIPDDELWVGCPARFLKRPSF